MPKGTRRNQASARGGRRRGARADPAAAAAAAAAVREGIDNTEQLEQIMKLNTSDPRDSIVEGLSAFIKPSASERSTKSVPRGNATSDYNEKMTTILDKQRIMMRSNVEDCKIGTTVVQTKTPPRRPRRCFKQYPETAGPTTFQLQARQDMAVHRFVQYCAHEKGILLVHSVGTGKTITSLSMALNSFDWEDGTAKKIVLVIPGSLFRNFEEELKENIPNISNVSIDKYTKQEEYVKPIAKIKGEYNDKPFTMVGYKYGEINAKYNSTPSELDKKEISTIFENAVVIFDEAHRLFRPLSPNDEKKTLDIFLELRLLNRSKRYILMTGTPYNTDLTDTVNFMRLFDCGKRTCDDGTEICENIVLCNQNPGTLWTQGSKHSKFFPQNYANLWGKLKYFPQYSQSEIAAFESTKFGRLLIALDVIPFDLAYEIHIPGTDARIPVLKMIPNIYQWLRKVWADRKSRRATIFDTFFADSMKPSLDYHDALKEGKGHTYAQNKVWGKARKKAEKAVDTLGALTVTGVIAYKFSLLSTIISTASSFGLLAGAGIVVAGIGAAVLSVAAFVKLIQLLRSKGVLPAWLIDVIATIMMSPPDEAAKFTERFTDPENLATLKREGKIEEIDIDEIPPDVLRTIQSLNLSPQNNPQAGGGLFNFLSGSDKQEDEEDDEKKEDPQNGESDAESVPETAETVEDEYNQTANQSVKTKLPVLKQNYKKSLNIFNANETTPFQNIRRRYLKLSLTKHPNKGGTEEEWKPIQIAFEMIKQKNAGDIEIVEDKGTSNLKYQVYQTLVKEFPEEEQRNKMIRSMCDILSTDTYKAYTERNKKVFDQLSDDMNDESSLPGIFESCIQDFKKNNQDKTQSEITENLLTTLNVTQEDSVLDFLVNKIRIEGKSDGVKQQSQLLLTNSNVSGMRGGETTTNVGNKNKRKIEPLAPATLPNTVVIDGVRNYNANKSRPTELNSEPFKDNEESIFSASEVVIEALAKDIDALLYDDYSGVIDEVVGKVTLSNAKKEGYSVTQALVELVGGVGVMPKARAAQYFLTDQEKLMLENRKNNNKKEVQTGGAVQEEIDTMLKIIDVFKTRMNAMKQTYEHFKVDSSTFVALDSAFDKIKLGIMDIQSGNAKSATTNFEMALEVLNDYINDNTNEILGDIIPVLEDISIEIIQEATQQEEIHSLTKQLLNGTLEKGQEQINQFVTALSTLATAIQKLLSDGTVKSANKAMKGGVVVEQGLGAVRGRLGDLAGQAAPVVEQGLGAAREGLGGLVGQAGNALGRAAPVVKQGFGAAREGLGGLVDQVGDAAGQVGDAAAAARAAVDQARERAAEAGQAAATRAGEAFEGARERLGEFAQLPNVKTIITNFLTETVRASFSSAMDQVNAACEGFVAVLKSDWFDQVPIINVFYRQGMAYLSGIYASLPTVVTTPLSIIGRFSPYYVSLGKAMTVKKTFDWLGAPDFGTAAAVTIGLLAVSSTLTAPISILIGVSIYLSRKAKRSGKVPTLVQRFKNYMNNKYDVGYPINFEKFAEDSTQYISMFDVEQEEITPRYSGALIRHYVENPLMRNPDGTINPNGPSAAVGKEFLRDTATGRIYRNPQYKPQIGEPFIPDDADRDALGNPKFYRLPGYKNLDLGNILTIFKKPDGTDRKDAFIPRKVYRYPLKEVEMVYIPYTDLQKMELAETSHEIMSADKWYFTASGVKPGTESVRNPIRRGMGNFSFDHIILKTTFNNDIYYPKYTLQIASNEDPINDVKQHTQLTQKYQEQRGAPFEEVKFDCPKFRHILLNLLLMKTGKIFTTKGLEFQPHLRNLQGPRVYKNKRGYELEFGEGDYDLENFPSFIEPLPDPKQASHYYLPIVYSTSDILGLGPFAVYLESLGFQYIVLHDVSSKATLDREQRRALQKVYPLHGTTQEKKQVAGTGPGTANPIAKFVDYVSIDKDKRGDLEKEIKEFLMESPSIDKFKKKVEDLAKKIDKDAPLCVLLHPDITEGVDAKHNPAIILMEPPHNFGDYEQLCGRVLRTYAQPGYKIRPKKVVYQYLAYNHENLENIYNNRFDPTIQGIIGGKNEAQRAKVGEEAFYDKNYDVNDGLFVALEKEKSNLSDFVPKDSFMASLRMVFSNALEFDLKGPDGKDLNPQQILEKREELEKIFKKAQENLEFTWGQWVGSKLGTTPDEHVSIKKGLEKVQREIISSSKAIFARSSTYNRLSKWQSFCLALATFTGQQSYSLAWYNRYINERIFKAKVINKQVEFLKARLPTLLSEKERARQQLQEKEVLGRSKTDIDVLNKQINTFDNIIKEMNNMICISNSPDLNKMVAISKSENEIRRYLEVMKRDKTPDLTAITKCIVNKFNKSDDIIKNRIMWCDPFAKFTNEYKYLRCRPVEDWKNISLGTLAGNEFKQLSHFKQDFLNYIEALKLPYQDYRLRSIENLKTLDNEMTQFLKVVASFTNGEPKGALVSQTAVIPPELQQRIAGRTPAEVNAIKEKKKLLYLAMGYTEQEANTMVGGRRRYGMTRRGTKSSKRFTRRK